MPFRSEAQRRFLWKNHPDIARRWTREHGSKVTAVTPSSSGGQRPGAVIRNIAGKRRPAGVINNIRRKTSPGSSQIRKNAYNKLKANGVVG